MNLFGMEIPVVVIAMFFTFVPMYFLMFRPFIASRKADAKHEKFLAELAELNKPLPTVYEKLGSYDYGKGAFTIELTTSWHNRHARAPYYLRVVSVEGSVVCTSELYDNVSDAVAVGMGQVRWAAYLSGRIPMEYLHTY